MSIFKVLIALVALASRHVDAADAGADAVDLSGVWLPDSKASTRWPEVRPFTAKAASLRAEWAKATSPIDLTRDDPNISCIPYTLPAMMTTITQYPFEIVATPERVYLLTETFGQIRRIDLTGIPVSPETLPSRSGTSRGHWEGGHLVVETTHIHPEHEGNRYPGSPMLRFLERFSLEEGGAGGKRLINEITVVDPLVYQQPIKIRMVYKRAAPDVVVGEYVCNEDLWDQHRSGATSQIPWR